MKKIMHFTADWCNPCKRLKPIIEEYISNNPDVEYIMIDVDIEFDKAEEYKVMSIPTLIVIKEDGSIARHTGAADYEQISKLVNTN